MSMLLGQPDLELHVTPLQLSDIGFWLGAPMTLKLISGEMAL